MSYIKIICDLHGINVPGDQVRDRIFRVLSKEFDPDCASDLEVYIDESSSPEVESSSPEDGNL